MQVVEAFMKYIELGGYVMPPLVVCTLGLWFGLGYRFSAVQGRGKPPRRLLEMALAGELTRPVGILEQGAVIGARLSRDFRGRLDRELEVQFHPLRVEVGRFRRLTGAIVGIAPLLGLLGTVSGMIETFDSLGDMTLYSQSGGIAGGISQALLTTQFGLAVAIPGLILKGLLDRRQNTIEIQLQELKALACGEGAKRVHHE